MLTLMQIAALAVAGMCHALLGSVKVPLARKLEIDEARVGGLVSVFGFTLIPMVLAAGFLVDSLGKQAVLSGGFVLLTVSLVTLARLRSYPTALSAVLVLGTGWSALVNVLNVTSPPAFLPPEEIATRMAYAMNMGDFIFGMGAFVTPLLVAFLIRKLRLEPTFLVLASFALVPLVLAFGVDWEKLASPGTETVAGGLDLLLSDPIVWLCCLAFFFHVPIEASIATWATTLMTDKGVSEGRAATLLSAFWLTFMGSRLVTALTLPAGRRYDPDHHDGGVVHRLHAGHRLQPLGLADLYDGRARRPDPGSDLSHVDRHLAQPRAAFAARPHGRPVLLHRRHRLDRHSDPDRRLGQAHDRAARVCHRHGLRHRPYLALRDVGSHSDLATSGRRTPRRSIRRSIRPRP